MSQMTEADEKQRDDAIERFDKLSANAAVGTLTYIREDIVREAFTDFASSLSVCTAPGREWSLVLTKLEEAFAWALRAEPKP